ncbi:MAG: NAD(+) diphosphatase [Propionibacteriaceae bacterium]|jgi:NAD+ diphosphatase|nr:NAD(+) diphosphatase [Propionibacteriaceae bacterium]
MWSDSELDLATVERADPLWVRTKWESDQALVVQVADGRFPMRGPGQLDWRPTLEPYAPQRHYFLALKDGRPYFMNLIRGGSHAFKSLRSQLGGFDDVQLPFLAAALANWHLESRFCPNCGNRTRVTLAGHARICEHCDREHFPRMDPAVIVAITDTDGRILLGRQPSWTPGRMSVFAGFIEAGESAEQAVHRELREEVGVEVEDVHYFGSQPWPFPRSLMLGFAARARSTGFEVDGDEIEKARWFTPASLDQAIADGEVELPSKFSIASRLIAAWKAGALG